MAQQMADFDKLAALLVIAKDRMQKAANLKRAFVPTSDPAMTGGAPPMDPAAMGGAPPMDPAAMGGDPAAMGGAPMDPAAMGGAPPMDPAAMGGAPPSGDPIEAFRSIVKEELAAAGMGTGGATGGAGGIKPKIDVNVELMQIKKMLARLADTMGVHIPASEMVATPQDLGAMAQNSGMPAAGGMPKSAVETGCAYDNMINSANDTRSRAAALAAVLGKR